MFQLSQCQDRMMELEKDLENPLEQSRVRFLEGQDMTPGQLQARLQQVSTLLLSLHITARSMNK